MAWLPLDEAAVHAVDAVVLGSWERDQIDSTWRLAGWSTPGDRTVSQLVFERMQYHIDIGARFVEVRMNHDPDVITGLLAHFAVFYAPGDPDDPDLTYLVESFTETGWLVDAAAGQERFDDAWREGCTALGARLGAPALIGRHACSWRHAVWRVSQRLVIVAQGEEFGHNSVYDAASVWVVAAPPEGDTPTGDRFYAFLCGDTIDEPDPNR